MYPSQVIQAPIIQAQSDRGQPQGEGSGYHVWIPRNEVFRIRNIFEEHDYHVPPQYLPSGSLNVIDIGANVGLFALYMKDLRHDCDVFCFEPAPQTVELLKRNTAHDSRIHVYPYALSNHGEMASLYLNPWNSGENSLRASAMTFSDTIRVPVKDAASALHQTGLTYIDIIKIDTEGSEVDILESLQGYLPYVGILMIEYHSEKDRRTIDERLSTHLLFDAKICKPQLGIVKYINARLI